jgi:predicted TPR repeat methyltransferase
MLKAAAGKQVYDELVHAEITAYLATCGRQFDVIVGADSLIYFGDLAPVVTAAVDALRPGGQLVFTLEEAVDSGPSDTFRLEPPGRYVHRPEYVERLMATLGVDVLVTRADLRNEGGLPVAGLVVRASTPAAASEKKGGAPGAPPIGDGDA